METTFSDIIFDETYHAYYLHGKRLNNVTAKIKELQKPFDREGIAQRVSAKLGKIVGEVLTEWEDKGEKARRLGIAVHEHIAQALLNQLPEQNGQTSFLDLNNKLPEIERFDRLWEKLNGTMGIEAKWVEWVIGDEDLGLAGTVDSVLYDPSSELYHIWDWKTGKFDLNNQFENLLSPFDHLDASKLHIYSLQVSLYRLILERNTGLQLGDSYLVHLTPEGHQIYEAVDLREPLLAWLIA